MILIITTYKSKNYGSFAQAKALLTILSKYDECFFLDFGQRKLISLREFLGNIIRHNCLAYFREVRQFHTYWKGLPSLSLKQAQKVSISTIVFGSDEIWNVEKKYYSMFFNIRLLKLLKPFRIFSYATSINTSTANSICNKTMIDYLHHFDAISVRDTYSKEMIEQVIGGGDISVSLDPTLLFDSFDYKNDSNRLNIDYIAIYTFADEYHGDMINLIKYFACKNRLKTVSVGMKKKWCDISIVNCNSNPFSYYQEAKYVVTNTYHGTAFAINHQKRFVSYPCGNKKIEDLLYKFEISGHDVSNASSDYFCKAITSDIDYISIGKILKKERKNSLYYIEKNIVNNSLKRHVK